MYAQRTKEIREKLKLSVAKMAKELEMSASTLTSYERGDRSPSVDFLSRLYITYNLNVNWFVSGSGEMFNPSHQQDEQLENFVVQIVEKMMKEKGLS